MGPRGRPPAFIPALVLARALELHRNGLGWAQIALELETTGNGTYARNTLKRRVALLEEAGQKQAASSPAAGPAARAARAATKSPGQARRRARGR